MSGLVGLCIRLLADPGNKCRGWSCIVLPSPSIPSLGKGCRVGVVGKAAAAAEAEAVTTVGEGLTTIGGVAAGRSGEGEGEEAAVLSGEGRVTGAGGAAACAPPPDPIVAPSAAAAAGSRGTG